MKDLVPLVSAVVGAVATIGIQVWISRGEPADLKRLSAINSILATMPSTDPGYAELSTARSTLALKVARAIAPTSKTVAALRRLSWILAAIGVALFIGSIALFGIFTPAGQTYATASMQAGLLLLVLAPALLYISWLWQELRTLPMTVKDIRASVRARSGARSEQRPLS